MSSELKIFHSLNCSLCASPYSKSSNDPKYPGILWCGKAICGECWRKEEALEKKERKHQCDFQSSCQALYKNSSFLSDLFNDPSIIESPNGNGWLFSEPITYPLKCRKCDVKYSMEKDESKPVILGCGQTICTKCYLTHQTAHSFLPRWFWTQCSICNDSWPYPKSIETRDNWLRGEGENSYKIQYEKFNTKITHDQFIKSIVDPYQEKFAKMDQELEEKFRAFEESLNKANETV